MIDVSLLQRLEEGVERNGLVVRRLRVSDEEAVTEAVKASLEHLRPWMPWAAAEPLTPVDRRALLGTWERAWGTGTERNVGVFDGPSVVGISGLTARPGPGAREIGYWTHVGHLRRGVASTAASVLTELAWEDPTIDRVEIHHDKANAASGGVPRRLGFRRIGERERAPQAPAETGIEVVWALTRPSGR